MNERQLQLFLRQAFALADREQVVLQQIDPALRDALSNIRQLVEQLPDPNSILREKTWREMRPQIEQTLQPYADIYERALAGQLAGLPAETAEEVSGTLQAVGVPAAPQTPVFGAPEGLRRLPLADSTQALLNTQVLGARLPELGFKLAAKTYSRIDQRVRTGMFEGLTTPQIVKGLAEDARLSRVEAKAITRTAIQDASRQLKEAIYDANADALSGLEWEWVAALDSRTCPTCAPLDGKRWKKRDKAPRWPVHINCRCQVVPVDPNDDLRERTGQVVSEEPLSGEGAYKSKIKVKGEKLYRKAVPLAKLNPTYADFLEQANDTTQKMFFGSAKRAEQFRRLIAAGNTPDQALAKLVKGGRFVKVSALPPVKPPPKPRPKAAPKAVTPKAVAPPLPPPPPLEEFHQQFVDSPKSAMFFKQSGGSGAVMEKVFAKFEQEGGEVGAHMAKLRQFAQRQDVINHFVWAGEDISQNYDHYTDATLKRLAQSQRRMVSLRARQGLPDNYGAFWAESLGNNDPHPLKTIMGYVEGAGGYTRQEQGIVVTHLRGGEKLGKRTELLDGIRNALKDTAAHAEGVMVPLPFSTSVSAPRGQSWIATYIHEMGHQVHFRGAKGAGYLGSAHAKKGGLAAVTQYGLKDEYERFAEAFVQYTLNPSGLREHAPGLYSWVEETMDAALRL